MANISRSEAIRKIRNSTGKFVTVTWTTKDGNLRTLNCRSGVNKGIKKVGKTKVGKTAVVANVEGMGYIRVYGMKESNYRLIDSRTIQTVKAEGTEFTVKG